MRNRFIRLFKMYYSVLIFILRKHNKIYSQFIKNRYNSTENTNRKKIKKLVINGSYSNNKSNWNDYQKQ